MMFAKQPAFTGIESDLAGGTRPEIRVDLDDIIALLMCLQAALFFPSYLFGPLRDRMLGLHEFLLDQFPEAFRSRLIASGLLRSGAPA